MDAKRFREIYETIVRKEATYDGIYYTGVLTTRIVCRPSCRARTPKPENIRLFRSVEEAIAAGFRPCKRCKPEAQGPHGPDAALAADIDAWLAAHCAERVTLRRLAEVFAVSPYHLQRTYKRVRNGSPADRLAAIRLASAKRRLTEGTAAVADIGRAIGMPGPSHFASWFKRQTGLTPQEYRLRNGEGRPRATATAKGGKR